jgi:ABC-type uncharacterized transport system.
MGIIVQYADKKEVMPVVQNLTNLEYDLTQAIMKVYRKTAPIVGVLKTDTLPEIPPQYRQPNSPEDFHTKFKPIFENLQKNYDVQTVEVAKGQPISPDIKTLVIPGGNDFSTRSLFEIDQYFMKGGNLIALVEAEKTNISQYGAFAIPQDPGIMRLLESYGAKVEHNMVLDASCGQVQIPQQVGPFQMNVAVNYPYFIKVLPEGLNKNIPAVSSLSEMVLPWASTVTLLVPDRDSVAKNSVKKKDSSGVTGTAIVKSSKKSWTIAGNFDLNPQQKWATPAEGFKQGNLMVYLTGNFKSYFAGKSVPPVNAVDTSKKDSLSKISLNNADNNREIVAGNKGRHLVVAADVEFLSSKFAMPGNIAWIQNVVDWLSSDDNLIDIRTRTMADRSIRKDELKEGSSSTNLIRYTNLLLMPFCVIAAGLFIFFKRRETAGAPAVPEKKEEKKS